MRSSTKNLKISGKESANRYFLLLSLRLNLPRSEVIAFFRNSIFDATSGSFADRDRKCLVNAAKTARKPPNKVARTTIFFLCGFDLISGMVGGLRS